MKLEQSSAFYGKEKAKKLGLTSERFMHDQMSINAIESIEYVKKKDRSDIKLNEWQNKKFYKSNATKLLFDCPDEIPRQDVQTLTLIDFHQKYQKLNLPVLIRGCTKTWNPKTWSFNYFYENFKETKFKIGQDDDGYKMRVQMKYYLEYLVQNKDDSPLYMFESSLEDKPQTKEIINNYQVPIYFRDDLFKIIGQKKRPPYRWLLMGPQRSGSTVHIDPLGTSAWNTSLVGHKRWVLFKEDLPKSIVKGKKYRGRDYEDESINYFTQILPRIRADENREEIKMIEFIQNPGQTVFVPGGWWHAVFNLDDTMAVTQNVMTHINFQKVWRHLRSERKKLALTFIDKLKQYDHQLFVKALDLNKSDNYQMGNRYEKQSVSMSFTDSSSSSSSSSSGSSSSSDESESDKERINKVRKRKNIIDKKTSSIRTRSYSRSRQKNNRPNHSHSEQKQFNSS